jgi:hypothetical protein
MSFKRVATFLALALLFVSLSGASGCEGTVVGSGEIATWEMAFTDFNRLDISQAFEVQINRASDYRVNITIDKKLYEYLKIDQRGDTLRINLKSGNNYIDTVRRATIDLPDLHRLKLSDASKASVNGFSVSHSLDFELNDASQLDLGPTMAGDCKFSLSDASQVNGVIEMDDGDFNLSDASFLEIKGSADGVSIDASDASQANLPDLTVLTADVRLSDASRAVINVSSRMDISLSSASSLEYIGSPKLGRLEMSGGSTLNQRQ